MKGLEKHLCEISVKFLRNLHQIQVNQAGKYFVNQSSDKELESVSNWLFTVFQKNTSPKQ